MSTLSTSINSQTNLDLLGFTQGIDLDKPLAPHEVKVQKVWAQGLTDLGIFTQNECQQILRVYDLALEQMLSGTFQWRIEDEDIHMNLERFACEHLGELGKKVHLGRSRNDLIATSLRLFTAQVCQNFSLQLNQMINVLLAKATQDIEVIVPGLTHLQFGQPVRLSQIYLAQAWSLWRDKKRLASAKEMALSHMPLGSAALGGTHLAVDLEKMASELGFLHAPMNSFDSVGDRDFMLQSLQAFSATAIHLSKMSEDYIIWASQPYSWVKLPKAWSTGSSIMPNKRNPDIAELVRAKSAQVIGAEQGANLLLKGLVSSYSSDLHELKRVFLQAANSLHECLQVFPHFIAGLEANHPAILAHLNKGHLLATEVANQITDEGETFRNAYKKVAQLIEKADDEKKQIHEMGFDFDFTSAVEKRKNCGGTAQVQIKKQIEWLKADITFNGEG